MAKSNLLKEAIADAKAVKETALANARLALEEAFAPRIQSMLSHKLAEELEDEDEDSMEEELDSSELGTGDNAEPSTDANDSSDIENDTDLAEEEDTMYSDEDRMDAEEEMDMAADSGDGEEYDLTGNEEEDTEEDDLDLEAVIRELEDAMASDDEMTEEEMEDEMKSEEEHEDEMTSEEEHEDEMTSEEDEEELDINEIIRTLKEMEGEDEEEMTEEEEDATEGYKEELEEAYKTIQSMRKTINEVNLLNAKLLYTNKLFRTFDLNESQKVKVIENFDRAANLREVKLVFATLGENLNVARKKKTVVKESLASKPMKSTAAPRKILSEGDAVAERFKKLAGLIK